MKRKKYKMISINYTNECKKKPRCSFCYLKKASIFSKLKETKEAFRYSNGFSPEIYDLLKQTEQVAVAFNGLKVLELIGILEDCKRQEVIINVTTNPEFLNQSMLALLRVRGVSMIALSLDPEKGTVKEWIECAKEIKRFKFKVAANILMLDEMFSKVPDILKRIQQYCYQIHLLKPKFYKTKIPLEKRKEMIWLLKQKYKKLFIDECFKWEFLDEPCSRGKDFISINADGTKSLCSFDIYGEDKKKIKKCPYI